MSYEEKRTWIYAIVAIAAPSFYFASLLHQRSGAPIDQLEYVSPMLWAIGLAIASSIVANILVGIFSSRDAGKRDERDQQISRRGFILGFFVFSILMVAPLVMAMAEVPHFWIANSIYVAFSLTAFIYSVLKIVSYRRGLA